MRASPGALMLLDTASLYFRAFYGVPDQRRHPDEPPNNAVRGLLDMMATLVSAHRPAALVACWDDDWRPAFRVEAIPSYKTHRLAGGAGTDTGTGTGTGTSGAVAAVEDVPDLLSPQVPVIVAVLAALGIARIGAPGYEADDVIGTLTTSARGLMPVDIVTGDRDLFQLIDDEARIRVLYTARGGVRDADRIGQAELAAKYDVATGDQYADLAVLRGDTSDGLPGVKGIGEMTGSRLIRRYGSLAALRAAVDSGDLLIKGAQRRNLEAASAYLDVAPGVVRVVRDIDLGGFDVARDALLPTDVVDPRLLSELAVSHNLAGPITRLLSALGIH